MNIDLTEVASRISYEYKREMDQQLFSFLRIHNISYATDYKTILKDLSNKQMELRIEALPSINGKLAFNITVYQRFASRRFDVLPPEFNFGHHDTR